MVAVVRKGREAKQQIARLVRRGSVGSGNTQAGGCAAAGEMISHRAA
jgi:hypothetical protein